MPSKRGSREVFPSVALLGRHRAGDNRIEFDPTRHVHQVHAMSNDSTIPSRLDPMHTVPAPLSAHGDSEGSQIGEGASPWLRIALVGAVLAAVVVAVRYGL